MPNAIREGSRFQIGKEVTPGTLVAASRRLIGETVSYHREQEQEAHEDHVSGVLARVVRPPTVTRNGTLVEYSAPLTFEEVLLIGLLGMKGGVTPTDADPEFTWLFEPLPTAVPGQDAYTAEWVESDLNGHEYEVEAGLGFLEEATIEGGTEGVPSMSLNIRARKSIESTATGALAVPVYDEAPSLKFKHSIGDAWADFDTFDQITGQILSFTWTFTTGLTARYYQDGRVDLDYSNVQAGKRMIDLTLVAAIDPQATGIVRSEQAHKDAGDIRFHRIEIEGDTIETNPFLIQLDGAYYHAADSMDDRGDDDDGVMTATIHLQSAYDPTAARDIRLNVVNALSAFPA